MAQVCCPQFWALDSHQLGSQQLAVLQLGSLQLAPQQAAGLGRWVKG
jgi:hypothetical protein